MFIVSSLYLINVHNLNKMIFYCKVLLKNIIKHHRQSERNIHCDYTLFFFYLIIFVFIFYFSIKSLTLACNKAELQLSVRQETARQLSGFFATALLTFFFVHKIVLISRNICSSTPNAVQLKGNPHSAVNCLDGDFCIFFWLIELQTVSDETL